ncbi:glyoxylate/hydroxypyruvate reductase A [Poseidonocella sp. HB161398]|uniref:2-hydroxyacid dehydrogenase n=1 Tax=Poseidonocella sp. HB161398 TaxID=2320855 RepID=UPI00110866A5|nr:glyoxylate/hydroxypyruvate reductase A [Poseidonocella sp. HB161398]
MTETVPFCSRLPAARAAPWLEAFARAGPGIRVVPRAELSAAEAQAARVAIVADPDPADLDGLPALDWVQSLWAGVEGLMPALAPRGLHVVRMVDPALADSMAEAVLGHVLYLHRRLPEYLAQQRAGLWQQLPHVPAGQRRVAMLGLGALGRAAAGLLAAQGFAVTGWSRRPHALPGIDCRHGEAALAEVLSGADIAVLLLPATPATRHLLDAERLAQCRPGIRIVNVARGALIDEAALLGALDRGQVGHAVLDVVSQEPLPATSPLWRHPSVTLLPHVAALTDPDSAGQIVLENLARYFDHGQRPGGVDRAAGY